MRVKAWAIVDRAEFRIQDEQSSGLCIYESRSTARNRIVDPLCERIIRVEIRELRTLPARKGKRRRVK